MATVTIADHQRVYSDRTVSVTGGTLTTYDDGSAIADGDEVYIYYDDPDRAGGAVTFLATTVAANALNSGSAPARHCVGYVTVPASTSTTAATGTPVYPGGLNNIPIA